MTKTTLRVWWWINALLRILGVVLPIGLFLALQLRGRWGFAAYLAICLIGGLLIRSWWSIAVISATVVAGGVIMTAMHWDVSVYPGESGYLGIVLLVVMPAALAAAAGTWIGKLIEQWFNRSRTSS